MCTRDADFISYHDNRSANWKNNQCTLFNHYVTEKVDSCLPKGRLRKNDLLIFDISASLLFAMGYKIISHVKPLRNNFNWFQCFARFRSCSLPNHFLGFSALFKVHRLSIAWPLPSVSITFQATWLILDTFFKFFIFIFALSQPYRYEFKTSTFSSLWRDFFPYW